MQWIWGKIWQISTQSHLRNPETPASARKTSGKATSEPKTPSETMLLGGERCFTLFLGVLDGKKTKTPTFVKCKGKNTEETPRNAVERRAKHRANAEKRRGMSSKTSGGLFLTKKWGILHIFEKRSEIE